MISWSSERGRSVETLAGLALLAALAASGCGGDQAAGAPAGGQEAAGGSGGGGAASPGGFEAGSSASGAAGEGGSVSEGMGGAALDAENGGSSELPDCPSPGPEPLEGQTFVIESVRFDRNQVTVRNVSGEDQTVTLAWRWCDFPHYGLLVESDDAVVAAGEAISVETSEGARLANGGEMGLYRSDAYLEPDDLIAYVTWGAGTSGEGASEREPVAAMAGVWTFGERVTVGVVDAGFVATGPSDRADGFTTLPTRCVFE